MDEPTEYNIRFRQPDLDSSLTKSRFCNKVVIVTGGASGIGRATVERFCNDGAHVAIFDINTLWGNQLEEELLSQDKKAKFYSVDVSDDGRCAEGVQTVADDNGGVVHFLVNCCAYFGGLLTPFSLTSSDTLRKTLEVNVVGASNMAKACLPFMEKAGSYACIVNVSSIRAHIAGPDRSSYSSSKAALSMLTKCMALDLSSKGIRVNAVSPGFVFTPSKSVHSDEPRGGDFETNTVGRKYHMNVKGFIEAAGIASVITFLCSKDATYIDGADVPVDCGFTAMGPEGQGQ